MNPVQGNPGSWSPPSGGDDRKDGKPAALDPAPPALRRSARPGTRASTQASTPASESATDRKHVRARQVEMPTMGRTTASIATTQPSKASKRKAEHSDDEASASGSGSDDDASSGDAADRKATRRPHGAKAAKSVGATGPSNRRKDRGAAIDLATPLNELLQACLPAAPKRAKSASAAPDITPMTQAMNTFFCGGGNGVKAARVGKGLRQLMPWLAGLEPSQRELVLEAFIASLTPRKAMMRVLPTLVHQLVKHHAQLGETCAPVVRQLAAGLPACVLEHHVDGPQIPSRDSLVRMMLNATCSEALWTGVLGAVQDLGNDAGVDEFVTDLIAGNSRETTARPLLAALASLRGGRDMPVEEALRIARLTLEKSVAEPVPDSPVLARLCMIWCNALAMGGPTPAPAHAQALRTWWMESTDPADIRRRGEAVASALLGRQPSAAALAELVEGVQRQRADADAPQRAAVLVSAVASVRASGMSPFGPIDRALYRLASEVMRLAASLIEHDGMAHAEALIRQLSELLPTESEKPHTTSPVHLAWIDQLGKHGWLADRPLAVRLTRHTIREYWTKTSLATGASRVVHHCRPAEAFLRTVLERAPALSPDAIACLGQACAQALSHPDGKAPTHLYQHPLVRAALDATPPPLRTSTPASMHKPTPATLESLARGFASGVPAGEGLTQRLIWTARDIDAATQHLDPAAMQASARGFIRGLAEREAGQVDTTRTVLALVGAQGSADSVPRLEYLEAMFLALGGPGIDRRLAWEIGQALARQPAQAEGARSVVRQALDRALGEAVLARARTDAVAIWDQPAGLPTPPTTPSAPRTVREGKGDEPDGAITMDPLARIDALWDEIRHLPALPATLPPLPTILPAQRDAARLWLALAEQAAQLPPLAAGTAPTGAHARLQEALDALQPFARHDPALAHTAAGLRTTLRAFESRYAADLTPTDWMHDAIVLGWRLGAAQMLPAARSQLLLARVERLRTLAQAPAPEQAHPPGSDPVLAGLLQAMVRPANAARPDATTTGTVVSGLAGLVFMNVAIPADAAARPALVETAARVMRWTLATARDFQPVSPVMNTALVASLAGPAAPLPDLRSWLGTDQRAQLVAAAAEGLQLAGNDEALATLLATLSTDGNTPVSTTFAIGRALRPLLAASPQVHGARLAWALARLAPRNHLAPERASTLAMGLCPSHATARTLLHAIRALTTTQQANFLRVQEAANPAELRALRAEIPRELATLPGTDTTAPVDALDDEQTVSLAMAWIVACWLTPSREPGMRRTLAGFTARPAAADAPPPRLDRQTLCRSVAMATLVPMRTWTDPVLAALGSGRLMDQVCSLPQLQSGSFLSRSWEGLLLSSAAPLQKLEAASHMARHVGRIMVPAQMRAARLQLTEEFMQIAESTAPADPQDEQARADYVVRLTEAASHIAAVYHRLRDNPSLAFAYQPAPDPARQLEQIRAGRRLLENCRDLLALEIAAVSRTYVHERLRAALLPILEGLHAPVVAALALDIVPPPATGGADVDMEPPGLD